MFTNAPRPNAGPRHARNNGRQAYPISLQTTGLVNRDARYSYTDTPTELQRPNFQSSSSPVNSMIEESPIQPPDDRHSNMTAQTQSAQFPVEKVLVSSPVTSYSLGPPHEVHPALYAPLADPTKSSEEAQNTDIRQPADALPNKMRKQPTSPVYNSTYAQRDTEPKRVTSTGAHTLNLYNPDSLASPNIIIENHHPGQVSHPNAIVDPQWKHGLCEIDTLCCTGLFCPCVLYGRTQYRLSKKEQKQDPTDLLGYESVNGSCGIMAVACGLQWILATIQRTRLRRTYRLEGGVGDDCVKGLCCCCCVLMQDEREIRDREEVIRRYAGPSSGYAPPPTMSYAPPPR